jgi:ribosomal protein S12
MAYIPGKGGALQKYADVLVEVVESLIYLGFVIICFD